MARRYSGDLTIVVSFNDQIDRYCGRIVKKGEGAIFHFDDIGLSEDLKRKIAVDSPEAYDAIAKAAISFAGDGLNSCAFDQKSGEAVVFRSQKAQIEAR